MTGSRLQDRHCDVMGWQILGLVCLLTIYLRPALGFHTRESDTPREARHRAAASDPYPWYDPAVGSLQLPRQSRLEKLYRNLDQAGHNDFIGHLVLAANILSKKVSPSGAPDTSEHQEQGSARIVNINFDKLTKTNHIPDFYQSINNDQITDFEESVSNDQISDFDQSMNNDQISDFYQSINNDQTSDFDKPRNNDQISEFDQSINNDQMSDIDQSINRDQISDFDQSMNNDHTPEISERQQSWYMAYGTSGGLQHDYHPPKQLSQNNENISQERKGQLFLPGSKFSIRLRAPVSALSTEDSSLYNVNLENSVPESNPLLQEFNQQSRFDQHEELKDRKDGRMKEKPKRQQGWYIAYGKRSEPRV